MRVISIVASIAISLSSLSNAWALTITEGGPVTWEPKLKGGTWWGDVATPKINQLWALMKNPTPDIKITSNITYRWACQLPVYPGSVNTLKLVLVSLMVDGKNQVARLSNPTPNTEYRITVSPKDLPEGWHELSFKCAARDQALSTEQDNMTMSRVSFGVQFGTPLTKTVPVQSVTDYETAHSWYGARNSTGDKDIGYQLSLLRELSTVHGKTLSGEFPFKIQIMNRDTGNVVTAVDHIKLLVDGVVPLAQAINGRSMYGPAEWVNDLDGSFLDNRETWDIEIDTAQFCNGKHWLAVHSHKIEIAGPDVSIGSQLASQTEVPFYTSNAESLDCP